MRFQLDHDWQGNMATPRARIGESAKTHLLIVLCAIWILLGLIGHHPWKPLEANGISIVKGLLDGSSWLAPLVVGETSLNAPPLYYLSAAASAKVFSPVLSLHDGARLINAFWLTITLLMVGMAGRELWDRGVGRHATFIMMGTIGLVLTAHSLTAEVAGLASTATGFYAFALSKRRPWRASALLGTAFAAGFLSYGVMPVLILFATALLLPLAFKPWRTTGYATVISVGVLIASPFILTWGLMLHSQSPLLLAEWWQMNLASFNQRNHAYFLRILIWYAWPALPLALWGIWCYRSQLFIKPKFQLMLVFFAASLVLLGFGASNKDLNALPLLLPLVALGAGSVEHLKREAAAALNWFGITLFALAGFLIWLGWFAMMTGYPAKIKERMQYLSSLQDMHFHWLPFIIAIIITLIWMVTCIRAKQTNKSTVTNWAVGMTFGWGLLMTLWLPMLDSAKSYHYVFSSFGKALPANYACVNSLHMGKSQQLLLNYYTDVIVQPLETTQRLSCDLYLIQDERGEAKTEPGSEWNLIWSGKRAADRRESFRLYQANS
ncbi:MAG: glycosyl transferase [Methylotenera sp.]|nr:MAG: glycosyl transferase [Methylotenera sp.]